MKLWEEYGENLHRMEVDGGYLYNSVKGLVFVPVPKPCRYCGADVKKIEALPRMLSDT